MAQHWSFSRLSFGERLLTRCDGNTKDENLAVDSVVPGNPLFKVHRPLIFLQENEAVRLTYLSVILQAAFYATFTGDTPSCPLHAEAV